MGHGVNMLPANKLKIHLPHFLSYLPISASRCHGSLANNKLLGWSDKSAM